MSDAVQRLDAIVQRQPAIDKGAGCTLDELTVATGGTARRLRGEMALHDVKFKYPARPGQTVLQGCSLTLDPHRVTAL